MREACLLADPMLSVRALHVVLVLLLVYVLLRGLDVTQLVWPGGLAGTEVSLLRCDTVSVLHELHGTLADTSFLSREFGTTIVLLEPEFSVDNL